MNLLFWLLFAACPIESAAISDHTRNLAAEQLDDGIGDTLVSVSAMTMTLRCAEEALQLLEGFLGTFFLLRMG